MTYNVSFMSNGNTTLADVTIGANNLLGGWLFTVMLVVIYIVIVASFLEKREHEPKKVLLYASFVIMILSLVLWSIGFIPGSHLAVPGFLIFIGLLGVFLS